MDVKSYISGERLQELCELTVIFADQRFGDLWPVQIKNTNTDFVVIYPGDIIPEKVYEANSLFIYTHALDMFFERIFPNLKKPIKLMSHNSDIGIEDSRYDKYLDSDKIIKWFAQNVNHSHPKLKPIPIGIANSQWPHGDFSKVQAAREENLLKTRILYNNVNVSTSPCNRAHIQAQLRQNGIPENPPVPHEEYLRQLAESKFCICPFGSGYDTHRLWESLYLGAIPVMPYSVGTHLLTLDFPTIQVADWSKVTIDWLKEAYNVVRSHDRWNYRSLYIEYWKDAFNK